MAPNYDFYGSDYSFSTGKGLVSSFFNVPGSAITHYGDKGALAALIPSEFLPDTPAATTRKEVVDVLTDPRGLETAVKELHSDNPDTELDVPIYYDPNASYGAPSTPQQLQYVDAPYAELYGMDASTAYQEALANTAYQRKVKDLKAAGLNPVLGYSGAGAASFYGSPASSMSGGVSYGSVGSGRSTSDLGAKLEKAMPYVIGHIATLVTGKQSVGSALTGLGVSIQNAFR